MIFIGSIFGFIGFVFLALGIHNIDSGVRSLMYVGILDLIFGGVLLFICLYNIKPIETKTEVGAVCKCYNDTTAGIVEEMTPDLESDGCTTVETGIISVNEYAPEEDVDLLARLLTAEMGYGASEEEYLLTGAVVWNRMRSDDFPDTLEEVIYQPGQYQCVVNGHIEREYDDLAWEIANEILMDGIVGVPEDLVFQAEFEQGSKVYKQIGRTFFCCK